MADQDDVRRIALSLPEVEQSDEGFAFGVRRGGRSKGFAWVWQERVEAKKPRVPNAEVLAVRVAGEPAKAELIAADPQTFFTEPHYNGFPAVLARLGAIDVDELEGLIRNAWRCQAPAALVRSFDEQRGV